MAVDPKVGKIHSVLMVPCAAPPQIWVKAMAPALLTAFITLIPAGWKNDIKMATGKSWLKHLRIYVRDADIVTPSFYDGALETMFELAEWADKSVWYMFLASVTLDFLLDWTSLVWEMAGCAEHDDNLIVSGDQPNGNIPLVGEWMQGPEWNQTFPTYGAPQASSYLLGAYGTGSMMAVLNYHTLMDYGCAFEMRYVWRSTGQTIAQSGISQAAATTGHSAFLSANPVNPYGAPAWVDMQVRRTDDSGSSFVYPKNGRLTITKNGVSQWL
jgi:hypothetical protein